MIARMARLVLVCGFLLVTLPSLTSANLERRADAYDTGDYKIAVKEWQPLADSGDPNAQYNMAVLYESGLGVARDPDKAAELYALAAEQGLADAQFEVGNLYLSGFYGSRDRAEAIEWYRLASDQEHFAATYKLRRLGALEIIAPKTKRYTSRKKSRGTTTKRTSERKSSTPRNIVVNYDERTDDRCPKIKDQDYEVHVEVHIPRAPIDHSRSINRLNHNASFHDPRQEVLGLAASDFDLRASGRYASMSYKGKKCFWVNGIKATMVYRSMTIYIASEYKKGSCEYRHILKHEKQHVENARLNLLRFEPRVKSALVSRAIPRPSQPKQISPKKDAEAEMERLYAKLLQPVYVDMLKSLNRAQKRLDSPASYARVFSKCSNW